jgi:hypothetical protein
MQLQQWQRVFKNNGVSQFQTAFLPLIHPVEVSNYDAFKK